MNLSLLLLLPLFTCLYRVFSAFLYRIFFLCFYLSCLPGLQELEASLRDEEIWSVRSYRSSAPSVFWRPRHLQNSKRRKAKKSESRGTEKHLHKICIDDCWKSAKKKAIQVLFLSPVGRCRCGIIVLEHSWSDGRESGRVARKTRITHMA